MLYLTIEANLEMGQNNADQTICNLVMWYKNLDQLLAIQKLNQRCANHRLKFLSNTILNQFWKMFNQWLWEKSFLLAIKHNSHEERKRIDSSQRRQKMSELQAKEDHLSSRMDTLTTEPLALYGKQGQINWCPFSDSCST